MLQPGTMLDNRHQIEAVIGQGGFGYVYRARDSVLSELVAIKELNPGLVGDAPTLKRFVAEAKATLRLTHERIVRTYYLFPSDDNYYIVMEYMAGGSLEQRIHDQGALPMEAALRAASQVCEGLAYAHAQGVVHSDLKPANILFSGTAGTAEAKIADFGVAHVSDQMLTRTWHTSAGFVAGTLPYMSPEQADGVRDDPRIDVYALGAVLYRMLTGRTYLAFDPRDTPRAYIANVTLIDHELPPPPSAHEEGIPAWLDGVVLKALAKAPGDRYAGIEELGIALRRQNRAGTIAMEAADLKLAEDETVPAPSGDSLQETRVRPAEGSETQLVMPEAAPTAAESIRAEEQGHGAGQEMTETESESAPPQSETIPASRIADPEVEMQVLSADLEYVPDPDEPDSVPGNARTVSSQREREVQSSSREGKTRGDSLERFVAGIGIGLLIVILLISIVYLLGVLVQAAR